MARKTAIIVTTTLVLAAAVAARLYSHRRRTTSPLYPEFDQTLTPAFPSLSAEPEREVRKLSSDDGSAEPPTRATGTSGRAPSPTTALSASG